MKGNISFVLNSVKCDNTGKTAAYLQFGREMRTADDVINVFRAIIDNENFVPDNTTYLKRFAGISSEISEIIEEEQDQRKTFYDEKNTVEVPCFIQLIKSGKPFSNAAQKRWAL
ncbi:integrase catalytic domain-containing protein [Trichonephila clavipes]|uniref:Integrase catalytic domain-containing protein n=1 Tax=Trichonephila clavipes TaxID=2585209 RepID=A0A8X6SVM4_TRICX|nr:integrase catalytic domain-containing protein [Trichonephila clavipes]